MSTYVYVYICDEAYLRSMYDCIYTTYILYVCVCVCYMYMYTVYLCIRVFMYACIYQYLFYHFTILLLVIFASLCFNSYLIVVYFCFIYPAFITL